MLTQFSSPMEFEWGCGQKISAEVVVTVHYQAPSCLPSTDGRLLLPQLYHVSAPWQPPCKVNWIRLNWYRSGWGFRGHCTFYVVCDLLPFFFKYMKLVFILCGLWDVDGNCSLFFSIKIPHRVKRKAGRFETDLKRWVVTKCVVTLCKLVIYMDSKGYWTNSLNWILLSSKRVTDLFTSGQLRISSDGRLGGYVGVLSYCLPCFLLSCRHVLLALVRQR